MQNSLSNIPVFILAGGMGTRLSEETHLIPKPMIEIGGIPILVHIMRWYYSFGFNDFVICAGYKSWDIKHYFLNYQFRTNHFALDTRDGDAVLQTISAGENSERWRVRVIDTGLQTMTGARVARALDVIAEEQSFGDFALTYGDGVCNVDLKKQFEFHKSMGKVGTVLGVAPQSRFGEMTFANNLVTGFNEKPDNVPADINGGFFFFKSNFRKYLSLEESSILERQPLEKLAKDGELSIYQHRGFWQCMDTLRDKSVLQQLWETKEAPWRV